MSRILIVYATRQRQTERIAAFLARQLEHRGYEVALYDVENIPMNLNLNSYDALIVGAPVRMRKFSSALEKWVRNNGPYFYGKATAFFSVCLGIMDTKHPETKIDEDKIVHEFMKRTQWEPHMYRVLAGALAYSQYNFFLKIAMWFIAWRSGSVTSLFKDYEYTNWQQVTEFCEDFIKDLKVEEKCERMILA